MARISFNSTQNTKTKSVKALQKVLDLREINFTVKPITQTTTSETIKGYSIRYKGDLELAMKYKSYAMHKFGIAHKRNSDRSAWQSNKDDLAFEDNISLKMFRVGYLGIIEITAGKKSEEKYALGLMAQWAIYDKDNNSKIKWLIPFWNGGPGEDKLPDISIAQDKIINSMNSVFAGDGYGGTNISCAHISYYLHEGETVYIIENYSKSLWGTWDAYNAGLSSIRGIMEDVNNTEKSGYGTVYAKPILEGTQDNEDEYTQGTPKAKLEMGRPTKHFASGHNGQALTNISTLDKVYMNGGELYGLELQFRADYLIKYIMVNPKGRDKQGIPFGGDWEFVSYMVGNKDDIHEAWNYVMLEDCYPQPAYSEDIYQLGDQPNQPRPMPVGPCPFFKDGFIPELQVNQSGTELAFIIKYQYIRPDRDYGSGVREITLSRLVLINLDSMTRKEEDIIGHIGQGKWSVSDVPYWTAEGGSYEFIHGGEGAITNIYMPVDTNACGTDGVCYDDTPKAAGHGILSHYTTEQNRELTDSIRYKLAKGGQTTTQTDIGGMIKVEYDGDKLLSFYIEYGLDIEYEYTAKFILSATEQFDGGGWCGFPSTLDGEYNLQFYNYKRTMGYQEFFMLNDSEIAVSEYTTERTYYLDTKESTEYGSEKEIIRYQDFTTKLTALNCNDTHALSLKHRLFMQYKNNESVPTIVKL